MNEWHPKSEDQNAQARSAAQMQSLPRMAPMPKPVSPGLYLVATPIGNLRDMTLRALDVLQAADLILAEDTRTSAKLMQAYGLSTPLSAYHDHNAAKRVPTLLKKLQDGAVLALISDAGTPLVSDPGHKLVHACIEAGVPVHPVPGASSVLAALVSAGLRSDQFMFVGFLPAKSAARKTALSNLTQVPASLVFFETSPRLVASLSDMRSVLGDRPAVIARELTKTYEEILRGSISELIELVSKERLRGEIVVVVDAPNEAERWSEEALVDALRLRVPEIGVKRASSEIAKQSGHSQRDVYKMALGLKDE